MQQSPPPSRAEKGSVLRDSACARGAWATRLAQARLSHRRAAELVATVAESLHYAHKQGLVHRDVKPGNILVASDGQPFVVDFGLALREEDSGKGARYAGTPAYFSPEQARGEGHRVDGRSDIFGLGIVLYEFLVGQRPFRADSNAELLEQISSQEPRPPRQHDESIPKELERICFKTLAKRTSGALQHRARPGPGSAAFPRCQPAARLRSRVPRPSRRRASTRPRPRRPPTARRLKSFPRACGRSTPTMPISSWNCCPARAIAKGSPIASASGKRESKRRDPDSTFAVGLIYGPSGCGKSSLVKAGLLPELGPDVVAVYLEATADAKRKPACWRACGSAALACRRNRA